MIQFFNNVLNQILAIIKYVFIGLSVVYWILSYPINRAIYEISKRKSSTAFFNHPNFLLLNWIMKISKYFNKFIF